jgi:hypothetical protein
MNDLHAARNNVPSGQSISAESDLRRTMKMLSFNARKIAARKARETEELYHGLSWTHIET